MDKKTDKTKQLSSITVVDTGTQNQMMLSDLWFTCVIIGGSMSMHPVTLSLRSALFQTGQGQESRR